MRPQPDVPLLELFIKIAYTILQPSAFDRNPHTTEALLQQLLIRQFFPRVFAAAHSNLQLISNSVVRWCHRLRRTTTLHIAAEYFEAEPAKGPMRSEKGPFSWWRRWPLQSL